MTTKNQSSPWTPTGDCRHCHGTGEVVKHGRFGLDGLDDVRVTPCPRCDGTGQRAA